MFIPKGGVLEHCTLLDQVTHTTPAVWKQLAMSVPLLLKGTKQPQGTSRKNLPGLPSAFFCYALWQSRTLNIASFIKHSPFPKTHKQKVDYFPSACLHDPLWFFWLSHPYVFKEMFTMQSLIFPSQFFL